MKNEDKTTASVSIHPWITYANKCKQPLGSMSNEAYSVIAAAHLCDVAGITAEAHPEQRKLILGAAPRAFREFPKNASQLRQKLQSLYENPEKTTTPSAFAIDDI